MENTTPTRVMQDCLTSDGQALRGAFGRFATGVTVITAQDAAGDPVGITANSFASVSLDPALLLWSPAKSAGRHDVFVNASHFAVHILCDDQRDLGMSFVKEGNAFGPLDWETNDQDVPLINGVLARFECRRYALTDAGDHTLILGEITRCAIGEGAPLVFSAGAFGGFSGL